MSSARCLISGCMRAVPFAVLTAMLIATFLKTLCPFVLLITIHFEEIIFIRWLLMFGFSAECLLIFTSDLTREVGGDRPRMIGIRLVNQGNMTTGILLRALQVVTVPALGYSSQQGGETHRSLVRRKGLVGLSTIPTAASAAILRRAEAATRAGTILRFAPNPAIPCDISCDMAF